MGIVNVTPDSFSDGGRYFATDDAIARGLSLLASGADYVDVGGESTRPGAGRVPAEEEMRRVLPVVTELAAAGVRVSVDTTRASVAEAAIDAGAVLVNDVSGGLADARMARVVADAGVPWVLMHWRGHSRRMYAEASYRDVMAEVKAELLARVDDAASAGVEVDRLVVDPGLGFAKHPQHDLSLLARLGELVQLGLPVLVGASRKRFLGTVLSQVNGQVRSAGERDAATVATSALAARAGAWGVRVHDTSSSADAVRVVAALRDA
jgi:dihydropteroate synthase